VQDLSHAAWWAFGNSLCWPLSAQVHKSGWPGCLPGQGYIIYHCPAWTWTGRASGKKNNRCLDTGRNIWERARVIAVCAASPRRQTTRHDRQESGQKTGRGASRARSDHLDSQRALAGRGRRRATWGRTVPKRAESRGGPARCVGPNKKIRARRSHTRAAQACLIHDAASRGADADAPVLTLASGGFSPHRRAQLCHHELRALAGSSSDGPGRFDRTPPCDWPRCLALWIEAIYC